MKRVFLFPGQGAQYIGMGQDLYDANDKVRALFDAATAVSGFDVAELLFRGTMEELSVTDKTQIAVTVTSIAAAYYLQSLGVQPSRVAGFSLGEYAAMVVAEVLSVEDALRAVKMRGDIMERVSRTHDSGSDRSGLIAVIGLTREEIDALLTANGVEQAFIAIHNSPSQIVIGGTPQGLRAAEAAVEGDASRVIRLAVSGPFHTPLMTEASERYAEAIADIEFRNPVMPMYSNVSGAILSDGQEMKKLCVAQLTQVVQWVGEQKRVVADSGSDTLLLEVGPGRVLRGLWRALSKSYAADVADIPKMECAGTCQQIEALVYEGAQAT